MRRGEYGFDAPHAPVVFGVVSVASAVFFLANAVSFLYTTRRGKFVEWARILGEAPRRPPSSSASLRALRSSAVGSLSAPASPR